jgi:3'(2'), 5'-bisphosphate nucleotidase
MENSTLFQTTAIAREAGAIILEIYGDQSYTVTYKDDQSPLTAADLASESCIVSALQERGLPVLSEEAGSHSETRRTWEQFWLVDPLDGTKDFISRNGEFTVNIALIKRGCPVLGVIYAPAIDTLYYAEKGKGAFLEREGEVKELPVTSSDGYIVTVSRQHLSETGKDFLAMNGITAIEQKGSSLKFGVLAEGTATLYPRFEGSMEWDIAAGHIIATEAGCRIIDLKTGQEPVYNKESLRNNPFIAFAPQVNIAALKFPALWGDADRA